MGGESVIRTRWLKEEELILLRTRMPSAKLKPASECAIWILLGTACRVGELTQSRWTQIVGDELDLPKELTKTNEPHTVVLSPFVLGYLEKLREHGSNSEWLFPAKHHDGPVDSKSLTKQVTHRQRGKPVKGRSPATTELERPGGAWHIHDLRRNRGNACTRTWRCVICHRGNAQPC